MTSPTSLRPEQLYTHIDLSPLGFETTGDLEDIEGILGQDRAIDALRFGVRIRQDGFNMFVLGPAGVGKYSLISQYLEQESRQAPQASDWVYVANFKDAQKPRAIALPAGQGNEFKQDMQHLIQDLHSTIPSAFEAEQYQRRHQQLHESLQEKTQKAFAAISQEAAENDVMIIRGEDEITFVPAKDGKPLTKQEYDSLSKEQRDHLDEVIKVLEEKLRQFFNQRQQWQVELRQNIRALNREVGIFAVGHLIEVLRNKYADIDKVVEYLSEVQADVIENLQMFFPDRPEPLFGGPSRESYFSNYQVNVLVDNSQYTGAPVIFEDTPRHQNLVGRVEHMSQMGTLITDYTMIKPGTLHKANGGFLVIDALKLLQQPYAWEGLKRALYSKYIKIQSLGEIYSLISTVSLEPEPIPLDVKVVLVGERIFYYLLLSLDPEFAELFKVEADFEDTIERSEEQYLLYAKLIATLVRRDGLLNFDRDAVARVIEHSMRMAEDVEKLSMHIHAVADVLREAEYWAREEGAQVVGRKAVQMALDKQVYRADRIRQRHLEEFRRGQLLLDTEGGVVAQVNGLFVVELGNITFGHPARITATARLGEGGIVDIEREVELGGAIHSKGVFIISAFLGARYSRNTPLSLSASLVFEQSYGAVEGDSASVAELCALLSALAEVPVNQSLAVTGSVNQHGQVQPIGGVNEKVEGFFDVCCEKGLTGKQGVLVPATNIDNLMLRQDVLDTVATDKFHIYPVSTIDEVISLLTGIDAGEADADGNYPVDSLNGLVDARLQNFAELRHEFGKSGEEHGEE